MTTRKRVAILVSGRGANMAALIAAAKSRDYPANIALVVSNRPQAAALGRARAEGIATAVVDHADYGRDREAFERAIQAEFEAHRIALGVPRGGLDFSYGDAFPHEADMDQLHGVDFAKGCYVGQEVVSRMQHRGSARTRTVAIGYAGAAPQTGIAITAGERQVGTMGSAAGGRGLALLRLDRVAEAFSRGEELFAGTVPVRPIKPDWASFAFPDSANSETANPHHAKAAE